MPTSRFDIALARLVPDPEHFSTETWARNLEQFEGRSIQFLGLDLPSGYFGACIIVMDDVQESNEEEHSVTEYVIYANDLSPAHRDHVKSHELAHITLNHPTLTLTSDELASWSSNGTLASKILSFCCRASQPVDPSAYLQNDREAERLTRLVYQRVLLAQQRRGLTHFSSQQDLENGLERLGIG